MTDEELQRAFAEMHRHFDAVSADNRGYTEKLSADNRAYTEKLSADNRAYTEKLSADNRAFAEKLAAENRHYFGVIAEELKRHIELVAEGRTTTDDRLTREVVRLDERIDAGAEEATALRFAHNKLDARVGVLEDKKRTRR